MGKSIRFAFLAFLAVAVVVGCAFAHEMTINYVGYMDAACGSSAMTLNIANNAGCVSLGAGGVYGNVTCNEAGEVNGVVCTSNTCSANCGPVDGTGKEYQPVCLPNGAFSASLQCINATIPVPADAPVEAPAAPGAPEAPTAPVASPVAAPELPLIGSGYVLMAGFLDSSCTQSSGDPITLNANYSECQSYTPPSYPVTFYFRADCYTNQYSKAAYCTDHTCSSCTAVPSAASGTCTAASISLIRGVKITCPTPTSPTAPTAPPSSDASTQIISASLYIAFALSLLAML